MEGIIKKKMDGGSLDISNEIILGGVLIRATNFSERNTCANKINKEIKPTKPEAHGPQPHVITSNQ